MPEKFKDTAMFTVPVQIGEVTFSRAMLDLGVSINVMPYSMYQSLEIGPLLETRTVIQLADRSTIYPKGLVKDVIVKVDKLIFSADFYVIEMPPDKTATPFYLEDQF